VKVHSITLGTAGHIDHGKSELIRVLTGIHPDRLKEEKERGMTIDLGYSFYETASGLTVGIIDVPGHERFIKNMVAGATSMDIVILAVAADDGVMPQTREHLDIMTVLGIEKGVVALTKIDLVDADMVELAVEDVKDLVRGTFLENAPIMPVSSQTGAGFDRFRETLDKALESVVPVESSGVFRMPVQRVFSAKGFGTVVTGVPVTGTVRVGDPVEIFPGGQRGKIRGIQAYGRSFEEGRAGHRTAINIADVDYRALKRGDTVTAPDSFRITRFFEAEIRSFATSGVPLKNMAEVRVHTGTSEVMGRIVLLDRRTLAPGGSCLVQLRLRDPVVVVPGDCFILRLHSPLITIGGGRIVGLTPLKLKRFKDHIVERVAAKRDGLAALSDRVLIEAETWRERLFSPRELALALNEPADRVAGAVGELRAAGDLVEVRPGLLMHGTRLDALAADVVAFLDGEHTKSPLVAYADTKLLRRRTGLEGAGFQGFLKVLEERGLVETAKGGLVRRAGFAPEPTAAQAAFMERIEKTVRESGAAPPAMEEVLQSGEIPAGEAESAVRFLVDSGRLVKVGGYLFHADVLEEIGNFVRAVGREHGEVMIPLIRDRFKTSRKWMIPLMEHFDATGLTYRVGEKRLLKEGA